jgi:uncharacterized repeat protein (TIGR01451 family)
LTLVATINAGVTAGTVLTNTATVGGGGEVNLANDTATDPLTVAGVPDLQTTKTHVATSLNPGGTVTYTITPNNTLGTAATSGAVTMSDALPAQMTAVSFTGAGWTCTLVPLACTSNGAFVSIPAGSTGTQPLTLVATINAGVTAGTVLTNTATVGGGGEVNLANDTATDPLTVGNPTSTPPPVPQIPDMTIGKSHTGTFTAGQVGATYTITTSNVGNTATTGTVTVTDTLPTGMTATAISGSGWNCVLSPLSCNRNDPLGVSAFYPPITVTVNIATSATGTLVNTAVVGGGGETNLSNDTATDPVTILGLPDMTITKTHVGTSFAPGGTVTFTLTASNVGATPTTVVVTVSDMLPAGLTATAISGGSTWSCTLSPLACVNHTILNPGASFPSITLTANIAASARGTLVNNVTVGGGGEVNLTNDTASDSISVLVPDLTITKTHTGANFFVGGNVTFTLTASNVGVGPTSGTVTVTDALPAGLAATAINGAAPWSCTLTPLACSTTAVLAAGAAYPPISVTANITATGGGTLVNNTTVGGGSETNLTNDNARDSIVVLIPDMTITKTHTGTTFAPGGTATFTLTASNVGPVPTFGTVTVTDTLPAGLTAISVSGGSTWTCTLSPLACTTPVVLAAGAGYPPITLVTSIASSATGTLTNNTTVGGGGETNLANDNAGDSITLLIPDLTIVKSHIGTMTRGGTGTYNLAVSNVGAAPTVGTVTVTDQMPAGLTATAISGGSTWSCTLSPLGCSATTVLAPGAAYPPITLTVNIAGNAPASVINVATVGGGGETNLTNDTSSDPTSFTGNSPDLLLTKAFEGTPVRGGSGLYQLTVMNDGTAPTTGVVTLSDPLPSSLTATGISGPGWTCSLVSISCTRSDVLAPGSSYPPVNITVNIASNAPANIVNVANTVGGGAPTSSGGTAQNTVTVAAVLPTITLVKTADRTTAQLGDVVGYTITINNTNQFPYSNDVVNDVLPAGFEYVPGSARLIAGSGAAAPIVPVGTTGTIVFNLPTLGALQTDTITYRIRIGARTAIGQNVNTAQFTGTNPTGGPVASQAGGAGVNVTPGFFTMQQFLIGRVFVDANGNGSYDKGERPLAGVRVYLSTGQSASTDSQGLYNIPVIAPGSVVVALDPATAPKGYTISSGGRLPDENWSRLVRTPLQGGIMLRQNFALKRCPNCAGVPEPPPAPPVVTRATSTKPAARIEVLPQQDSIAADGRSTMTVHVRVLDADGNLVPAKEIRVRASAGQFVPATDSSASPGPSPAGVAPGESNVLGVHTKAQLGRTTEQVPDTLQAGVARMTQGEATFRLMAANQPGTAEIVAESGDPDHLLQVTTEITFLPEKRGPILATDGEVSVGRAAPDLISYGQDKEVVRHGEAFLRTPLGDDFLLTLAYTSHLTINDSNGNPGLFQLDPLNRVYPIFGDSSTQYQMAQSNSHVYGRLDHQLSYLLFGDIRMGANPAGSGPFSTAEGFVSQPGDAPSNLSGAGDYNRNVVGAAIHLEDKRHNSLTLEGARPNTAFARDIFPGSTFGLIQLSHVGIVPGTDNGVLEVRDRNNPEILISRESLVRSVDYSIDVTTGGIFFLRTLNAFDMNLDLVQLVFTYEYLTIGQTSSVYGARSELRLSSIGLKLGLGFTDQRDPTAGSYYLGNATILEKLPNGGHFNVEVPVSHGSALAAGYSSSATDAPADVNGTAIRADLSEPFGFMHGRLTGSFSKTDQNFFNPFGTIVIPGSLTLREAVELTPVKGTKLKLGYTEERNHTSLVNNHRQSGSLELKQFLTQHLSLVAGYDYRDFQDTMNVLHVNSNEVDAGLDWRPTNKFTASVKREQNLTASDPTYPNETLLSARYQASETVRLYLTQRFASAPILPIADLSTTGLVTPSGKNETSLGIEDKWSRYTSINTGYLIENGINGTDSYAVMGLVNRIPLDEHVSLDLGLQRGQLLTGKDGSFDSGTIGFSWLPVKSFRMSTRYELRDQGGLGEIFTVGAAGRLSQGVTMLGRYQLSSAAFNPGSGAIDMLSSLSTNPILSQQTNANQGTAALAWRNWKTDREGLLFSWTMQTSTLDGVNTTLPENDRVNLLMTDAYYQPHRRIEFYGKFAFSDRQYNYVGDGALSTQTYLYQGRTQVRIGRRFDAALEARFVMQPDTSIDQWTAGAEGGFWLLKDLRVGLGYNFKSADQIAANFLTNPVKQGVYFVLSSKLSNMFNLFDPGECKCAATPTPVVIPPAPKPVANIQISAITGARDVCPGENLRLQVTAGGWRPDQRPVYQWYVNDRAVPGATGPTLMVPTADGFGMKSIRVTVTAGSITRTSNTVNMDVKRIAPPTIQFSVMPSTIAYGEKAPLTATAAASECAMPPVITYTASEGAIAGTTFDSSSMRFDMTNRTKPQSRAVQLTATATDRIGQTAVVAATITVTLQPEARRLDDIVFAKDSDRVNNCGKRLLLDELTPMLRADPEARVVLIGHRDGDEKKAGLDEGRVLNAAAVFSAGTGICPQLDLSRILFNAAGTDQASETRPALCGSSVCERTGQGVAESDKRAAFRRVEVWIVPGGAQVPASLGNLRTVPATTVRAKGCPK